jgi:hypothetical protein
VATLRQAIERLRAHAAIPMSGVVSLEGLRQQFQPLPSSSVRALMGAMYAKVSERKPWAVILCRFKGSPAELSAKEEVIEKFFLEAFTPGTGGFVEYWRDVSLGAIDISGSRVFGWVEVEIERSAAGGTATSDPPGPGRAGLTEFAVNALKRREGDRVLDGLLGPIVVYTENWSIDNVPPGTTWKTPGFFQFWIDGSSNGTIVCVTPPHDGNITAHEMGHVFGMNHDVDADLDTDYMDPSCIMSQNGALTHPRWQVNFGPALCLPHLMQQGWIYKRRIFTDGGGWMAEPEGISLPLAPISRPGVRANLGIKLAFSRGDDHWDYYLEYMVPTEWNRAVPGAPYLLIRRMAPKYGGTPAYLAFVQIPSELGQSAEKIEPSGNVLFRVQLTSLQGPTIRVTAKKL